MIPGVATLVCAIFIGYLFWIDLKRSDAPSHALWIPLIWMFLAASRYASAWLGMSPAIDSASDYAEGSPIDRAVFFSLIAAGLYVLARRKLDWGRVLTDNWWIWLYFFYCLSSAAWADDSVVVAKRWIKETGNIVMALVVLTERRPYEAIATLLRRLTFLFLPLSLLFIKYYPALARDYRPGGGVMYTGIGNQKNDLGLMCLLAGVYLLWEVFRRTDKLRPSFVWENRLVAISLGVMAIWLLRMSDSKTPVVCLIAVFLSLIFGRLAFLARNPTRIVTLVVLMAVAIWLLSSVEWVKAAVLQMLGREPTLTNRTEVWELVSSFSGNPFVGVGFMSFWSGQRMQDIWRLLGSQINQAHNGYLEQFLNLGYVGVFFIVGIMILGLLRAHQQMKRDLWAGMLRLCFLVVAILYNVSEASFYGLNDVWILLLLAALAVPDTAEEPVASAAHPESTLPTAQARLRLQRFESPTATAAMSIDRPPVLRLNNIPGSIAPLARR